MLERIKIKSLAVLILASVISGLVVFLFCNPFAFKIILDIQSEKAGPVQVFYKDKSDYKGENSTVHYVGDITRFHMISLSLRKKNIRHIRIDTPGDFMLRSVTLQNQFYTFYYDGNKLFKKIRPLHGIEKIAINNDIIIGTTTGNDPYFTIEPIPFLNPANGLENLIFSIVIAFLMFLLLRFLWTRWRVLIPFLKQKIASKYFLLWGNMILSITIFSIPPESGLYLKYLLFFVLVFVLPGFLLLIIANQNRIQFSLISAFVSSVCLSLSFFVISMFLVDEFNIKTSYYFIYLLPVTVLLSISFFQFRKRKIPVSFDISSLQFWVVLNVCFFVFIQPTKGLFVAPRFDPIANSYIAQFLLSTSFADIPKYLNFYPPGMGYITALFSGMSNITTAKAVLITTNIFNLLTGVSFALFFSSFLKTKKLFIFLFLSMVCFPGLLAPLYYWAGKNSQIFAYFMIFGSLYLLNRSKGSHPGLLFMAVLSIVATMLIHFNTLSLALFFILILYYQFYRSAQNKIVYFRDILKAIVLALPFVVIMLLMLNRIFSQGSPPGIDSGSISGLGVDLSLIQWKDLWKIFIPNSRYSFNIYLGTAGLVAVIAMWIFDKRQRFGMTAIVLFNVMLAGISLLGLGIFTHYNKLNIELYPVLLAGMFFFWVWRVVKTRHLRLLIGIMLLTVSMYQLYSVYNKFNITRDYTFVDQSDMDAYEWISNNTSRDEYFMPAAVDSTKHAQLLTSDGSLYLKVFAFREDAISYISGNEFAHYDKGLRNKYSQLVKNPQDTVLLRFFLDRRIKYIYEDLNSRTNAGTQSVFNDFPSNYEVVYNSPGVIIYQISIPGN